MFICLINNFVLALHIQYPLADISCFVIQCLSSPILTFVSQSTHLCFTAAHSFFTAPAAENPWGSSSDMNVRKVCFLASLFVALPAQLSYKTEWQIDPSHNWSFPNVSTLYISFHRPSAVLATRQWTKSDALKTLLFNNFSKVINLLELINLLKTVYSRHPNILHSPSNPNSVQ